MPNSYLDITGSTATIHSYSTLNLLDNPSLGTSGTRGISDTETDEQQMRLFKNGTELIRPGLTGAEYSLNETTEDITLTAALIAADRLIIMRQTRRDRPYVTFTNTALLKQDVDVNLYVNQLIFIIQELNEEPTIQNILDSITYLDVSDKSAFSVTITSDTSTGPFDYSSISLISDDRINHEDQLTVIKNGTTLVLTTAYTVDVANEEVNLVDALISADTLIIRRLTSQTRYVPSLPNASSFSSSILQVQFDQLANLIQELPSNFGLDGTALRNYRNPRRKIFVTYSGPGDRFFYGNLPWYPDSSVFVWRDESLLTEPSDYTDDDWQWIIDLITSLLATETITIMVVPLCPFPLFFCNDYGNWGLFDPERPFGPNDGSGNPTNPGQTGTIINAPSPFAVDIQEANPDTPLTLNFAVMQTNPDQAASTSRWPNFEFPVGDIDVTAASTITLQMTTQSNPIVDKQILLRRILRTDWDLDNMTWNQYDTVGGLSWNTAGGKGADTDFEVSTQVTWNLLAALGANEAVISPDISAMITAAQASDNILRIQMFDNGPLLASINWHGNTATTVAFRPILIVTN